MSENYSKLRQQAEIAFGKTMSPQVTQESAFGHNCAATVARNEKTLRLREARLAKELQNSLK